MPKRSYNLAFSLLGWLTGTVTTYKPLCINIILPYLNTMATEKQQRKCYKLIPLIVSKPLRLKNVPLEESYLQAAKIQRKLY